MWIGGQDRWIFWWWVVAGGGWRGYDECQDLGGLCLLLCSLPLFLGELFFGLEGECDREC